MLKYAIISILCFLMVFSIFTAPANQIEGTKMNSEKQIVTTVLNYIEGWYNADEKRMNNALSESLVKRRITPNGDNWEVDKTWMVQASKAGRGKIPNPGDGRRDIVVLDQTETMCSVRLESESFIDYIHLAKVNNEWKIINVLWDYR